jgi:hypothetical protein
MTAPRMLHITEDEIETQVRAGVLVERQAIEYVARALVRAAANMDGSDQFRAGVRHGAALIVQAIMERK